MPAHLRHYIIYVPGLGDSYDAGRRLALRGWRLWGVRTELVPMRWYDGRPFQEKQERVLTAIQRAQDKGYAVSLIGESAGGSMAVNVAALTPSLQALVTVCGVNSPAAPVSPRTLRRAPGFDESIRRLSVSLPQLPLEKTHVVRAWYDPIVGSQYTRLEGAHNHRLWSIGHLPTITLCLTVFSGFVVTLIKRSR